MYIHTPYGYRLDWVVFEKLLTYLCGWAEPGWAGMGLGGPEVAHPAEKMTRPLVASAGAEI